MLKNCLCENNKIEKANVLNEMRSNSMTLQELRFLSIYLSKINARNQETRIVRFPLEDFRKIMDLDRLKIDYLKERTTRLLQKVITVPNQNGGYEQFQLFRKVRIDKDEYSQWFIEIDCTDESMPMFFDLKAKYFTYELWNSLRLKSSNQIRMYEILKQHQKQKSYTFKLTELRELLGIGKNEYSRFYNFRIKVLDACKDAIAENTDIKYDYEPIKNGAKVVAIKFNISKNDSYIDPLNLDEFLSQGELKDIVILREKELEEQKQFKNPKLELLSDACNNEFSEEELQVLFDLIRQLEYQGNENIDLRRFEYLQRKYNEMNLMKPRKSRFGYLKTLINADVEGGVLIG